VYFYRGKIHPKQDGWLQLALYVLYGTVLEILAFQFILLPFMVDVLHALNPQAAHMIGQANAWVVLLISMALAFGYFSHRATMEMDPRWRLREGCCTQCCFFPVHGFLLWVDVRFSIPLIITVIFIVLIFSYLV